MITQLEVPLFHHQPIGLRFEIGPENLSPFEDVEAEYSPLNRDYFEAAIQRVASVFRTVFEHDETILLTLQDVSDGRQKISKSNKLLKLIRPHAASEVMFSKRRDIYQTTKESPHWNQAEVTIRNNDLPLNEIFQPIAYSDFGSGFSEYCFFSSANRDVVLHLYDDRGMDVVASSVDRLRATYMNHIDWLLDEGREKMDETFDTFDASK